MSAPLAERRERPRPARRTIALRLDTPVGRLAIQIAAMLLFLTVWEGGVWMGFISAFLVGQPTGIGSYLWKSLLDLSLLRDAGYTLYEAILGFVIGTIVGSACGLGLWYSPFVARIVEPFIVAINSVPKIAFAPIVILWFGTGLVSKVMLSISLTAIVALIAAYQAAKDADPDLQALVFSMGSTKHRIFSQIVVPSTLPAIIATFRINVGFGLVGAVVGEFISSQFGLGHLIYTASSFYDLNTVWAGLFTLMFIGFVLYYAIDVFERAVLPWKAETATHRLQV